MLKPYEKWIEEIERLCKPEEVMWCDGSEEEAHKLIEIGIKEEKINNYPVFTELNQKTFPKSYYHRSHPTDVARTEHLTYICFPDRETAGPNNNWMKPEEAKEKLLPLFKNSMKGRRMYVIPFMMGHPESKFSKPCIQVTDSVYVAVSMRIMTRVRKEVLDKIGNSEDFLRGLHSIGDLNPERRFIMHFPEEKLVWSIGSGYGGNALLGKKCFSLRIASYLGLKEGWLAEHMAIIGIEDPDGKVYYIAAALPSASGKTNLCMLESTLPGYKVLTVGDDIAWLRIGDDGRLYAINPETGFFGVAPGTSMKTNPKMMMALKAGKFYPTLFTNTGINPQRMEPWWEGMEEVPENLIDWEGNPWKPDSGKPCSHPNARFTVSVYNLKTLSPEFDNPNGVPISAIIIGGKRKNTIPLVTESFDWKHGVFLGARMGTETTAAAEKKVGMVRRDPFAMLPFCGYNMADYFQHWLEIGNSMKNPPKIFLVNWFRTDENGRYLWPGFGDNIRVLKWIIDRIKGKVSARETPLGLMPYYEDLDLSGLNLSRENFEKLMEINREEWKREIEEIKSFFSTFGKKLPDFLWSCLKKLEEKI
jgi:phosphoenolpyruvate carboxykinase (GTP)